MNRIISSQRSDLIEHKLSQHTSFFGIKLWILITASASIAFLLAFIVSVSLCFISHWRRCRQEPFRLRSKLCLPLSHIPLNSDRRYNPYNRCPEYIESARISSQVGWSSVHLPYYTRSFSSTTSSFGNFTVFTFMEIESVTDGFADENLIAKGDSSMVYRGVLMGTSTVAVKQFFPIYQRYEDNDFITRAEMIANMRHKNVVRLLGYCIEGDERLAYFHEDIEPSHNDSPKNSNFVPSPNNLDEKVDVHCFGILIMELVSGRVSVDQSSPHVYLVDWIKEMVVNHKIVDVLDPDLSEFPTLKELKRIVLIALRCVDPEKEQRPKMGDVIHMLQPYDMTRY
ncbi:hypothetical protein Bca52824_010351 [Brassica carinata]|uniref:non-specific serine/threonine protein kinase n=1 Tax=Brassica carinata TaxID=52824 RepID=A0A8X8BAS1_BRACI|nr:hypothetical protein Bca52824_010351 [Brassica carinata]